MQVCMGFCTFLSSIRVLFVVEEIRVDLLKVITVGTTALEWYSLTTASRIECDNAVACSDSPIRSVECISRHVGCLPQ
jgi:hypothetical protein